MRGLGIARLWGGIAVLGLAALGSLAAPADTEAQVTSVAAEVTRVTGRVEVLRRAQTQWIPATTGMRLAERDEIRAYGGASAEIRLPDGSTLFLAENSRIVVTRLEYDAATRARSTMIHLAVGKVRAAISQAAIALVRTRQSVFAISTPTAVAAARGTVMGTAFLPPGTLAARARTIIACKDGLCLCGDLTTQSTVDFGDGMIVNQEATGQCGTPRVFTQDEAQIFDPFFPFVTLSLTDPGRSPIIDPAVVDTTVQGAVQAQARLDDPLITPTPPIPVLNPVSDSAPNL